MLGCGRRLFRQPTILEVSESEEWIECRLSSTLGCDAYFRVDHELAARLARELEPHLKAMYEERHVRSSPPKLPMYELEDDDPDVTFSAADVVELMIRNEDKGDRLRVILTSARPEREGEPGERKTLLLTMDLMVVTMVRDVLAGATVPQLS